MKELKIIDFEKKGNVVRFYLGDPSEDYWGDDWDDSPYEHNAGTVYNRYVKETIDIAFPFDSEVLEPADDWRNNGNSHYSKEDMKNRQVPCIIVIPPQKNDNGYIHHYDNCFSDGVGMNDILKFYFGDTIELNGDHLTIVKHCKMEYLLD